MWDVVCDVWEQCLLHCFAITESVWWAMLMSLFGFRFGMFAIYIVSICDG